MRRINNRPVAVEAVLTRSGTVVGPFMSELTGHKRPHPVPRVAGAATRCSPRCSPPRSGARAMDLVQRLGDRLAEEGYRGFFEVDVLVDTRHRRGLPGRAEPADSGRLRHHQRDRRRLRRRAAVPLPPARVHGRRLRAGRRRDQRALGGALGRRRVEPDDHQGDLGPGRALTATPPTGQYYLDASGALVFSGAALDWHQLQNEAEAFFLRIYGPGDYRWKGADLGILVTKGRLQIDRNGTSQLTIRAKHFIDSHPGRIRRPPFGWGGDGRLCRGCRGQNPGVGPEASNAATLRQ